MTVARSTLNDALPEAGAERTQEEGGWGQNRELTAFSLLKPTSWTQSTSIFLFIKEVTLPERQWMPREY